jgi:hypothetical protein
MQRPNLSRGPTCSARVDHMILGNAQYVKLRNEFSGQITFAI